MQDGNREGYAVRQSYPGLYGAVVLRKFRKTPPAATIY